MKKYSFLFICGLIYNLSFGQNVPILNFSLNSIGQAQLEIEASADKYYVLTALHEPDMAYRSETNITVGIDGIMTITDPLAAYTLQNYKVTAYSIDNPADTDGDGIDDITELNDMPTLAPFNFADEVPFIDGSTSIDNGDTYNDLALISDDIPWAPFLNDKAFVKFAILNQYSEEAEVYFINSNTHAIHANFLATINTVGANIVTGEIVYNPNEILSNGVIGSYSFNYSFGDSYSFEHTRLTFELLAANMPFLRNNFYHFIGGIGENNYQNNHKDGFQGSRVNVVLESEVVADIDYVPFHQAEGYGYFRSMQLDENPGSRDIVLYDALPNSLPRVGGIITSVIQTPLSHVNLRAIQDNVPNAYIKEPLLIDSISNLLNKYIYYKVDQDKYEIREATLEEVNDWYEKLRPTEEQIPDRDLTQTEILPLDDIWFDMADAFGAKCSNVATMRSFGFPDGTIPNGFGIPFYFYDEFMKFNGFYDEVEEMIADPDFISDLEVRIERLDDFRKDIRKADMPQWMLDELQTMHDAFPEGTSVRCRSSTNNEDLPGFSGAGLYTSKTQHPEEGHISKSVKQVYASMWNFRAYEERDFYRVDQYVAAMGILCHPNFEDEKSNGVGVSIDPIYETENTFYLNTQVGEFLITNPDANSIPEEILLNEDPNEGFIVLRNSNLVPLGELVMGEEYLSLMRDYLRVIHDEFAKLYKVEGAEGFGMDIEYKVTAEDQLIIKQARPWVSFWTGIKSNFDLAIDDIVEPKTSSTLGGAELVRVKIENRGLRTMKDFELSLFVSDQIIETIEVSDELDPFNSGEYQFNTPLDFSEIGSYDLMAVVSHESDGYSKNDTLQKDINKLYLLEGSLSAELKGVGCGQEVFVNALVTNNGETTFDKTEIEVVVNGMTQEIITYDFGIPYGVTVEIPIEITENLQLDNNEILLNLIRVNDATDEIIENNSGTLFTDLTSTFEDIILIINSDLYPDEVSWELTEGNNGILVESGFLDGNNSNYEKDICLDLSLCYTISLFDSYGDGICCAYGEGDFFVLTTSGDTLVYGDGDFGSETQHYFCPSNGCGMTASITTTIASSQNVSDGEISIVPNGGEAPHRFSINGGDDFVSDGNFSNLASDTYMVVVRDATEDCIYEEAVEVGFDVTSNIDDGDLETLKIYPNPTNALLHISDNEASIIFESVRMTNALGQEVLLRYSKSKDGIIDITHLNAGIYYLELKTRQSEKVFVRKIVKVD